MAAPVSARLRVSHVRSRPGPQGSRPAIVVSGSVVTQASGSVSVKAVTHSDRRTVAATARARIAHGHWRARLELPGVNPRPIHISARFGGSAGVQSDHANRLVRLR